jgi:hypothetical protein
MQSQEFRRNAAQLWQWVANVARNPDLATLAEQSTNALLHPGFVCPNYATDGSGTLVIGMNPGGGTDTPHMGERATLVRMRDEPTVQAFDELNAVATSLFRSWPIWRNNLLPLLSAAHIDPLSVAYIHAVPFRVADNAQLASLYQSAWRTVGSKQAQVLNPGRILLAGKTAGQKLQPLLSVKSRIVTRSIGDSVHASNSAKISSSHAEILVDQDFWR